MKDADKAIAGLSELALHAPQVAVVQLEMTRSLASIREKSELDPTARVRGHHTAPLAVVMLLGAIPAVMQPTTLVEGQREGGLHGRRPLTPAVSRAGRGHASAGLAC